jgi:hypothetical protein
MPRDPVDDKVDGDGVVHWISAFGVDYDGSLKNPITEFDMNTTNEVPFAKTRGDGTGDHPFEVQTAREASGLRCG